MKRPQIVAITPYNPTQAAICQRNVTSSPWDKIDKTAEDKIAHQKIQPTPEIVSSMSSVHPVMGEVGTPNPVRDVDMMAGIKRDLNTIRRTFSLSEVPRQAYTIGLAGVLPYLATSLSTVYCAWEINHATANTFGFLISAPTAEALLHVLEPLQVGYGAVIISFLGAIHWGLEWAGYGGYQGYKRYAIGVVAPAIAWPTILMPVEHALIAQFFAFTMLYYADTRAAYRGWTPAWYNTYRFVLTFIVGASIVISLIGRGEVAHRIGRLPGAVDRLVAFRDSAQETLAEEEEAIRAKQVKADEENANKGNEKKSSDQGGEKGVEEENEEGGKEESKEESKEGKKA